MYMSSRFHDSSTLDHIMSILIILMRRKQFSRMNSVNGQTMCCSFYLYLPIVQSYPTGHYSIVTTSVGYMVYVICQGPGTLLAMLYKENTINVGQL